MMELTDNGACWMMPIPLPALPERPFVTVMMASYNYGAFVGQAIQSVLHQTYGDFELIVCDDGSTDNSCEVIQRYVDRDQRVQLVRKPNGGQASCWNVAYLHSRGDLLCPLDADDAFYPSKLATLIDHFRRHPDSGLAVHAMTVLNGSGREVQQIPFFTRFERGWIAESVIRRGGRWRYMPSSGLGFRRELSRFLFPIPEQTFRIHTDSLVVTLAPLLTKVIAVEEPLSYYRVHGSNWIGGSFRDRTTAGKVADATSRTIGAVNTRLAELGFSQRLDLARNLELLQSRFILSLLDGKARPGLWREYGSLVAALFSDDLYRLPQKVLGLLVYGVAIPLPLRARAWWIEGTLGHNRMKHRIQKALNGLRHMLWGVKDAGRAGCSLSGADVNGRSRLDSGGSHCPERLPSPAFLRED
jgi:glycosyltransferase involved in cell wall biosynthesis